MTLSPARLSAAAIGIVAVLATVAVVRGRTAAPPLPAATPVGPSTNPIDLLRGLRIADDAIAGEWEFRDGALATPQVAWARLRIPWIPPDEYDLRLTVERKQGGDSLNVGFVIRGRMGMVMIDGNGGDHAWIDLATPYDLTSNSTLSLGRRLPWGKRTAVVVAVRREGVSVAVDEKTLIDWKGSPAELKLIPGYRMPDDRSPFIGSWETSFLIHELKLVPVAGTARPLR